MSIFISIAAYEDPCLVETIESALKNADKPEDLIFGLGLAYKDTPNLNFLSKDQKRVLFFDPDKRPGVSRSRYLIKELFEDEDYFLQIDSHMRFDRGWDSFLIKTYNDIKTIENNNKISISNFLNREFVPSKKAKTTYTKMKYDYLLHMIFEENSTINNFEKQTVMTAQFIFIDKECASSVKWDPYSHFLYEEPYLSFSFFMKGYTNYKLNNYSPILHDNSSYNLHLYKKQDVEKNYYGCINNIQPPDKLMHSVFLFNEGLYKIENALKTPLEFWIESGIENYYHEAVEDFNKINFDIKKESELFLNEYNQQNKILFVG